MKKFLALCIAAFSLISADAVAQDYDLDEPERGKAKRTRSQDFDNEIVREIKRGYYIKAGAGTTVYFVTPRSSFLRPGTTLNLAVGGEFLDQERMSAAWEFMFGQAIHNGLSYIDQGALLSQDPNVAPYLVQGDVHSFSMLLVGEFSFYPTRRFGIGLRAGGGVMFTPLLMGNGNPSGWVENVVAQTWGGTGTTVHSTPHPTILVGPTIEYYTKLSHFSIGADIDFVYAVGFEGGIMATGYMKYTF
jgi:hypothetical protein